MRFLAGLLCAALLDAAAAPAASQPPTERVIEISSRTVRLRALIIAPAEPSGSVVLLAGGHGNIDLGPGGEIGWGRDNQLVRSRHAYAAAGFVTLLPDVSPDLKEGNGVRPRSRWSPELAIDIAAWVAHLRSLAPPVHLVGTSRAALTVAKTAATATGEGRPDALVVTSGMIADVGLPQPSVERDVTGIERIVQPLLLVAHAKDGCPYTPATAVDGARKLFRGASRVDIAILDGGIDGVGDACGARSHHGFLGLDDTVVRRVTDWLRAVR